MSNAHFDEGLQAHTLNGNLLEDGAELQLQLANGHRARVIYYRKRRTRRGATLVLAPANGWEANLTLDLAMRLRWQDNAA